MSAKSKRRGDAPRAQRQKYKRFMREQMPELKERVEELQKRTRMADISEYGFAAVQDDSTWPFRGVLHGQANLARRFIVEKTFPNHDPDRAWKALRTGGWRIAKLGLVEIPRAVNPSVGK